MSAKIIDKDEKREAIVAAAAEVFSKHGFRTATMDMVSREAKIAKGTTYLYFKSKADLFMAVFDWYVELMVGQAEEATGSAGQSAREVIAAFVDSTLHSMVRIRDMLPLYMEFWAAASSGELRSVFEGHMNQLYHRYRAICKAMLQDGVDKGEFRADMDLAALASTLVGAMDGLMVQAWLDRNLDIVHCGRVLLNTIFHGLLTPGEDTGREQ